MPARPSLPERLLDVVLPVDCAGCDRPGSALCAECRERLTPRPHRRTLGAIEVWSGLAYDGVARRALLAMKNGGRTDLAAALAPALRAAVAAALTDAARGERIRLVRAARTHRSASERGYEPVAVLLRRAGLSSERGLRLVSRPADQAGLGAGERAANVAGTMRADARLGGTRVLLVDDVVTTGATLLEATRALDAVGAEVVGAAALAGVALRRP